MGGQRQQRGWPGQPTPSLPGARATPAQPASGGGYLPQPRWAVCAAGAGAHQGQTSREGEKDIWWTTRTARGGTGHLGRTETQRGRLWTACGQRCVESKNSQTTPATTSTSSIRQLLGAADAQTAHHATFSTAPTHQLLGSANAETTPARAPAAAADRMQKAARRNMRREEWVTVHGPVKKQQPDGMSHRGWAGGGCPPGTCFNFHSDGGGPLPLGPPAPLPWTPSPPPPSAQVQLKTRVWELFLVTGKKFLGAFSARHTLFTYHFMCTLRSLSCRLP